MDKLYRGKVGIGVFLNFKVSQNKNGFPKKQEAVNSIKKCV